jgi:hypothetical protein
MRRESATVVGLTGEITGSLLAALGRRQRLDRAAARRPGRAGGS